MPKKCKLVDIPLSELPEEYPFYYAKVSTPLMLKVERVRLKQGLTVKHTLEAMSKLFLEEYAK